jgi:NAD(P)H dehydrogenase (quinone)
MKMSVLYYSKTGCTRETAGVIVRGMEQVPGVEARAMALEDIDAEFVRQSSCVVLGSPTYYASMAGEVKLWLDQKAGACGLAGKLGGAFATAGYLQGGADLAIQNILTHLACEGMLVYSGGCACGAPPIHLGPVALSADRAASVSLFETYGRRMAEKAHELFEKA